MRTSREQTAASHERILATSSRLFREKGIGNVGVSDLMKESGMTHGGFYRHFTSKDALVAQSCEQALAETRCSLQAKADLCSDESALEVLVKAYLSQLHRDSPGQGCAIAAIGMEAVRQGEAPAAAIDQGIELLLQLIEAQLRRSGVQQPIPMAHGVLASMVGAVMLARALRSPDSSNAMLRHARSFILKAAVPAT